MGGTRTSAAGTPGAGIEEEARESPRKGTGAQVVHEALRRRILRLELAPGRDIDEAEVVRALGVSRTPVREALIRLASEQLVELLPNRGARVAEISLSSVREFFEALGLTQRAVTRWAAIRGSRADIAEARQHMEAFEAAVAAADAHAMAETNRAFHVALAAAAQNRWLARSYREVLDEGMRLSFLSLLYDPPLGHGRTQHLAGIVAEHRDMLAAVEAGAAERADAVARAHTERFRDRIMDYIRGTAEVAMTLDP